MNNQTPDRQDPAPLQNASGAPGSTPAAPGGNDHLSELYKMSRTAGLGSQEYVAVNATAVITLLLGLASAAAVLGNILLIIPAIAVGVGFFALRQITNSAGTETGKPLALAGMALALLFVALVGGRALRTSMLVKEEQGRIVALIDEFGQAIKTQHYDAAWALCNDRFRQSMTLDDFTAFWTVASSPEHWGPISNMRSTGILQVEFDPETGRRRAAGQIVIQVPKGEVRPITIFRKVEDRWLIESMELPFTRRAGAQQQPAAPQ